MAAGKTESANHPLVRAIALTTFVFSLLVWLYVVLIQVTHPEWLSAPFSHVNYFPFNSRLDEVGIVAFALAAFGFFTWQVLRAEHAPRPLT